MSILLGFAFTPHLLEVDVFINLMLMCWTYFMHFLIAHLVALLSFELFNNFWQMV
jgi:hypothetical protein